MRQFSKPAYISLMAQRTDEVWLMMADLKIQNTMFHVVANSHIDVVSNGITYTPYPFDLQLPSETLEAVESLRLSIDNVDRLFVDHLRAAERPLEVTIRFALVSQPDVIELEIANLESDSVEFNASTITATLVISDIWNAKYPSVGNVYDPPQFPGIF